MAKFVLLTFPARGAFNGYLGLTRRAVVFKYYLRKHVVNVKGKHSVCMLLVCGYATNGKLDNAIKLRRAITSTDAPMLNN